MWCVLTTRFYAPWCGHCKKLAPKFTEAARVLAPEGIQYGAIDATRENALKERFSVSGFPAIKFVDNDHESSKLYYREYKGPREVAGFVEYAKRMLQPALKKVSSPLDLETLIGNGKEVSFLMGRRADASSQSVELVREAFETIAWELQDTRLLSFTDSEDVHALVFASADVEDEAVCECKQKPYYIVRLEPGEDPVFYDVTEAELAVKAIAAGDTPGAFENGGDTASARCIARLCSDIRAWVEDQHYPVFPLLDAHNFADIAHSGKLLVVGAVQFDATEKGIATKRVRAKSSATVEALRKLSRRTTTTLPKRVFDSFRFGYLDAVKWKDFVAQFNVDAATPKVFVLDAPNKRFFEDDEVNQVSEIDGFLRDIVDGKVQAQHEGIMGLPALWLKSFQAWFPYSLVALLIAVLFLVWLVNVLCCGGAKREHAE